jgi:membrane protease YdiL (CAAX protease family)
MQEQNVPQITPEMLEQNPVLALFLVFVTLVILVAGTGSLSSWGWILFRWASGGSVLPLQRPWKPRLWSLLDVLFIATLIAFLQITLTRITYQVLGVERGDDPPLEAMAAGGLASLLGVLLGAVWITFRYRQPLSHLGFGALPWQGLLGGIVTGLAALPVVYLMMMVVNLTFSSEYEHPLIDSAAESGTLTGYFMGVFAAVIAAPIFEEFGFRVILQGWLQSLPFKSLWQSLWGGGPQSAVARPQGNTAEQTLENFPADVIFKDDPVLAVNPYGSPSIVLEPPMIQTAAEQEDCIPPIWPSVVVGILFGLAHYQYGLSFLPLSVLGILLGLVYRQTHSVWPCILIHMMLNGFSMMMLGLIILMKQATG